MFKLDERLSRIFQEASSSARKSRSAEGITTTDFLIAEIEDSKSELYSYLLSTEYISPSGMSYTLDQELEKLSRAKGITYTKTITVVDEKGKEKTIKLTTELWKYLNTANDIAKENDEEEIKTNSILAAIIHKPSKHVTRFLRSIQVDILDLEDLYVPDSLRTEKKKDKVEIPAELKGFVSVIKGDPDVAGRDMQINTGWKILMKKTKRNFILVGEQGVGKTAIVYKMASQLEQGTAPEQFKNSKIFAVDVNAIISGTEYRGEAEERFEKLINFIKKNQNAILFIDEAHLILGAGACREGELDLANALKPVLAGDYSRVIAATTVNEYERYFSVDGAIKRRFEKIKVEEPKCDEVPQMIQKKVESLSKYHGVEIDDKTIHDIIIYASCFHFEIKNPDRTLDLIDRSMVTAKMNGKTKVSHDDILENFEINMKAFQKSSNSEKLETAYHEIGHWIALYYLPICKKTEKPIAVSIYPTDEYLGVTAIDVNDVLRSKTKQEYLELIAADLAGGIAESIFTGREMTDGISGDASNATKRAKLFVAGTGVMDNFFYHEDELKTEKLVNSEAEAIRGILKEASEIAKQVIMKHYSEIEAIAKKLVKKGIMTSEEIEEVINSCKNKKRTAKRAKEKPKTKHSKAK